MQKIAFKNSQNFSVRKDLKSKNHKKQNNKIAHNVCATTCACLPSVPTIVCQSLLNVSFLKKMHSVPKALNEAEIKTLNETASKVLKKENLSKSINILDITPKTDISKYATSVLKIQDLQQVQQGTNAFFDGANSVFINRSAAPNLLLHELGHAHNSRFSSLSKKIMPLYRFADKIPFVIAFASLILNEEQPKEGAELTKFQKAKNAIRKTLPFVAAASSFPLVVEEGMASAKANKWIDEFLGKELGKKIKKSNKFGFLTYALIPASAFLVSFFGMKYKDFLAHKKSKKDKDLQTKTTV